MFILNLACCWQIEQNGSETLAVHNRVNELTMSLREAHYMPIVNVQSDLFVSRFSKVQVKLLINKCVTNGLVVENKQ